ncbi:MAG: anti-sigma factor family protein [Solirubrobacteraceae bacterium]
MIRRALARRRFMRDHRWTQAHLSDYLEGDLQSRERERAEQHVHWCPECRRVLESLRRTLKGLMELRATPDESIAPSVIDRLRRET